MTHGFKGQRVPVTNELAPNTILDRGEYHVSYNNRTGDYGCTTTAIVLKGTLFLILNGDHQKALAEISESDGLQGCFDYFLANIAQANGLSEHHLVLKGDNTFNSAKNAEDFLGPQNITRLRVACEPDVDCEIGHVETDEDQDISPEM